MSGQLEGAAVIVAGAVILIATAGAAAPVLAASTSIVVPVLYAAATAWTVAGTYVLYNAVEQDRALGQARNPLMMMLSVAAGASTGALTSAADVFFAPLMLTEQGSQVLSVLNGIA